MYITVHDGYDVSNWKDIEGRSTKQWDLNHWTKLIELIKQSYPDYLIVQLGSNTGRCIPGVHEQWLNKTKLVRAFDILKLSSLHIDGDSGLVHAATAMKVPCIVMFGPTPDYFYGYPQNLNLRASTCSDACFWLKDDWMKNCPIGHSTPKCMDDITAEMVFRAVSQVLK